MQTYGVAHISLTHFCVWYILRTLSVVLESDRRRTRTPFCCPDTHIFTHASECPLSIYRCLSLCACTCDRSLCIQLLLCFVSSGNETTAETRSFPKMCLSLLLTPPVARPRSFRRRRWGNQSASQPTNQPSAAAAAKWQRQQLPVDCQSIVSWLRGCCESTCSRNLQVWLFILRINSWSFFCGCSTSSLLLPFLLHPKSAATITTNIITKNTASASDLECCHQGRQTIAFVIKSSSSPAPPLWSHQLCFIRSHFNPERSRRLLLAVATLFLLVDRFQSAVGQSVDTH